MAGRHAWQGGVHEREDRHGRGHAWQGYVWQWVWKGGRGGCVAGETATAVDSTHPGMV